MAEGAPLLREYVGKTCIEGSNPSGSARSQTRAFDPGRTAAMPAANGVEPESPNA